MRNKKNNSRKTWIAVAVIWGLLLIMFLVDILSGKFKQNKTDVVKTSESFTVLATGKYTNKTDNLISAYDVKENNAKAGILVRPDTFVNKVSFSDLNQSETKKERANCDISASAMSGDLIILQFTAYTNGGTATLEVSCSGVENVVYVNSIPTSFYVPISDVREVSDIEFEVTSDLIKTTIDDVYLINYGSTYNISELMTGTKTHDEHMSLLVDSNSLTEDASTQCLVKDGYLFSLNAGSMTSYSIDADGNSTWLSSINSLGQTRDMVFNKDKSAVLITCRQNGVYIVDISEPGNLKVISHYDTLEATTGIYVSGDYAFMASRYFGIEIVDISNLSNPKYVNSIMTQSEYIDCFVSEHYLYVGVYANKRIDIYDIEDVGKPSLLSQINLDGAGQGCYVENGILYAATGLNSANSANKTWNYGTGTGNGLEIYDVSDPKTPVLLSITKIDGRFSYNSNNVWDVQVSGNRAYVSSMYNGLFVYDVSNPSAPKCEKSYSIRYNTEDEMYTDLTDKNYVFSWNTASESRGCFYHVVLENGKIYAAVANGGVYLIDDNYVSETQQAVNYEFAATSKSIEAPVVAGYRSEIYRSSSSVWAVTKSGDNIYVAAGDRGIVVLDNDLKEVNVIDTKSSVRDVKVSNGYLYTAESSSGIAAYKIDGTSLTKVSEVKGSNPNYYVSQIQLTGDGNYIIAQVGPTQHIIVNSKNPESLTIYKEIDRGTGRMYYRNICSGLVEGKYVGIYGTSGICWYYSDNGNLIEMDVEDNTYYRESAGMAAVDDVCVAITGGGYQYFKIDGTKKASVIKVSDASLSGKVSASGNTMVVANSTTGNVTIVNISDVDHPTLITEFKTGGNPDIAYVSEDMILIPCRYGGLIKLTK